jgi:hypothetical protein
MTPGMLEAIKRIKQDILDGHVLNYAIEDGSLYAETTQGWVPWPYYTDNEETREESYP